MNMRNKDGTLTAYGLACGLLDTSIGAGTMIERYPATSCYLARADGGHAILYQGLKLTAARAACRRYARLARRYWHHDYCVESQGIGTEYVARVRHFGVIIGHGPTVAAAMDAAARHEGIA